MPAERTNQPDIDHLVAAARTDPEALGALYEHFVEGIYSYFYHHTGRQMDAEDLTSRTFLRMVASLDTYKKRENIPFAAWLYRVAHNLCANYHRDKAAHEEETIEDVLQFSHPAIKQRDFSQPHSVEDEVENRQRRDWLTREVTLLPEPHKTVIILKHVQGFSNAEVATIIGRTEGAVKSLYHRSLVRLHERSVVYDPAASTES